MNLVKHTLRSFFILIGISLFSAGYCQQGDIYFTVPINLKFPDNISTSGTVQDSDSIYHDWAVLKLPPKYGKTGEPARLVFMAHGAGGGVSENDWFLNRYALKDSLLAHGYAVFDVNGGPLVENMGGSWSVQAAYKAYEHIRKNYNVHPGIFVSGFSMGGCSSVNFVYRHSNIVIAHAMYSPVLNLYGQAWQNPWLKTTRKAIAATHHFSDPTGNTWDAKRVTGWNPLFINTFYNGRDTVKIFPVPVKIWHGNRDKVVKIDASRSFQKYIENAGGYCELREIDSDDHGLSCGNPVMNRELLLFFKRFDQ
ncbi:alpha/beta hydrolase family protein [Dyadobacter bucti]|uniref:alpha/beta hydrolase family protein n=1 Tax=Dyadobacter bucti TaxID=2572203 RepID=UPI003F71BE79